MRSVMRESETEREGSEAKADPRRPTLAAQLGVCAQCLGLVPGPFRLTTAHVPLPAGLPEPPPDHQQVKEKQLVPGCSRVPRPCLALGWWALAQDRADNRGERDMFADCTGTLSGEEGRPNLLRARRVPDVHAAKGDNPLQPSLPAPAPCAPLFQKPSLRML
jgi:hypothetical protein